MDFEDDPKPLQIPQQRLIPNINQSKSTQVTTNSEDHPHIPPSFDLQNELDGPDHFYSLYASEYKCTKLFGLFLIIGSSSFSLALPIMIAFLIDQIYNQNNGVITPEEFKEHQAIFISVLASLNLFSSICRGLQKKVFHDNSQKMGGEMRYDLYYNYTIKVHLIKKQDKLDAKKS